MPNSVFTYILNIWSLNKFCRCTQLNDQTVLFLTIQFSINNLFALSLNVKCIWPLDRALSGATTPGPSRPGRMAMKRFSAFPKALALLEPYHLGHSEGILLLCRDAVCVLYSPSHYDCVGRCASSNVWWRKRCGLQRLTQTVPFVLSLTFGANWPILSAGFCKTRQTVW